MSLQTEVRAWVVASAAAFALSAIGYRVVTAPKLPDLNPTVAHIDAATGAWANASAQQMASVSAIERDLRAQLWHVDRFLTDGSLTLQAARGAINTANEQLTHVAPLLDSTRAAVDAVPLTLTHLTDTVDAARPILTNADGAVGDFRRFITAPALTATLDNVAAVTGSAAAISADAHKVTDKMTADYLKPTPWYIWPVKRGSELLDVAAAVARHTP